MRERRPMTIPEEDRKMRRDLNRRSAELAFAVWATPPAAVGSVFSILEALNDNSALAARAGIVTVVCSAFAGVVGLFLSKDAARDLIVDRRDRRARRR